jgi:hypothetical protein
MPDGQLNDQLGVREAKDGLPQEIDENTLRKYFTLTEADLAQVELCRGAINRLGFAVQLCTLRWLGYFLREMQGVPEAVIETMARQLGLLPISLESYPQHENTEQEHQERVRRHLGFVRCELPHRQQLLAYITDLAQREPRIRAGQRTCAALKGRHEKRNGIGGERRDYRALKRDEMCGRIPSRTLT